MSTATKNLFLCYIGLTVAARDVLEEVEHLRHLLDPRGNRTKLKEVHITLVPPFFVDYDTASKINMGCALSTLHSKSIVNAVTFSVQQLEVMHFEGSTIIHFPVKTYINKEESCDEDFVKRVQAFRTQIKSFGGEIRLPVPLNYTPHISVLTLTGNNEVEGKIQKIVKTSTNREPLYFRATYPTLYAKYKGVGYRDLSDDPSLSR